MSCERYEKELALSVAGDLPARQVALLEKHLSNCEHCRAFAQGIAASQATLKELADEPLAEAALTAVRTRVLAAVRQRAQPRWSTPLWAGVTLASAALLLIAAAVFWPARKTLPTQPTTRAAPERTHTTAPQSPDSLRPQSTERAAATVSQSVRAMKHAPVPRLSPEDADQLARAVVAISRLRHLDEAEPAAETEQPVVASAPLTRIASDDPNVVIYWQFDSNGG